MKELLADRRRAARIDGQDVRDLRDRMPQNLRRLLFVSIAGSVAFAAIFVFSDSGLGELRRLDDRKAQLSADIELIRTENERLRTELARPADPLRVERLAREELGLVKPGEVVLLLPPSASRRDPADRTEPPLVARGSAAPAKGK